MSFAPIYNYTHYSLQYGFSKPKELVQKCVDNGYTACGIADYKTISGAVSFFQACKKKDVKPIIGCSYDDFKVFAINKQGWLDLVELVSTNNYHILKRGNLLLVQGPYCTFTGGTPDDLIVKEHKGFQEYFYVDESDHDIHRISLCSGMKTSLKEVQKKLSKGEEFENDRFFKASNFDVPTKDRAVSTPVMQKILEVCEDYDILEKPMLPHFPTPNGESEEDYLKQLCREGWKELLIAKGKLPTDADKELYHKRFVEEFEVFKGADLFGYFLIVWDILNYINSNGWLSGPGRGSAAGCLISYLIGITKIDPIEFDLLFSRFYNAGRNTKDRVSLPDIDIDVPGGKRDDVINYLRERYGHDNVSQMITFGRLQGRSALKEVLRMNEACGFAEMNAMTKPIPDEAAISDQLELMDEEDRGIIKWTLINQPDDLMQFCHLKEDGTLDGEYAPYFDQAIRLEGTFKNLGKHAAGVVISAKPLYEVCPMLPQKNSEEKIAGLEMNDLEALGHVKFDVLGIMLLDKLMETEKLIQEEEDENNS